jgi:hypothetical protein
MDQEPDEDEEAEWWWSKSKKKVNGQRIRGKRALKLGIKPNTVTMGGFSAGGYKTAYIFNQSPQRF